MSADFSELTAFAAELRSAARTVASEGPKVIKKGALNIKNDARVRLGSRKSMPRLQGSISFDVEQSGDVTEAEIGPDQAISGLGLGTELGSRHHAPIPFLYPAFDAEVPSINDYLDAAVDKAFGSS